MHTRKSKHRTVTKFVVFVDVVCDTMCTKFRRKRTTFDEVLVKNYKYRWTHVRGPKHGRRQSLF